MYQATVPEGSGPGDLITVQVNGSAFQATVPAGVHAGEAFDVQPQSQASSGPICTIVATADGLDGVFRPEMPAALEAREDLSRAVGSGHTKGSCGGGGGAWIPPKAVVLYSARHAFGPPQTAWRDPAWIGPPS